MDRGQAIAYPHDTIRADLHPKEVRTRRPRQLPIRTPYLNVFLAPNWNQQETKQPEYGTEKAKPLSVRQVVHPRPEIAVAF